MELDNDVPLDRQVSLSAPLGVWVKKLLLIVLVKVEGILPCEFVEVGHSHCPG